LFIEKLSEIIINVTTNCWETRRRFCPRRKWQIRG